MKFYQPGKRAGLVKSGLLTLALLLQASCGGGGGTTASGPGDIIGTGIRGTAATGAALANATITIKSITGVTKTGTAGSNGKFLIDELADDGPYLLRADRGNGDYLYSVAHKGTDNAIARNIHPYTDLIIRNWFRTQGQDIDSAFAGTAPIANMPTEQAVDSIEDEIKAIVAQVLERNNVASDVDLLSTPFDANSTGFDAFLDNDPVVINNNQITVIVNDPVTNIQNVIINGVNLNTDFTAASDSVPTTPQNVRGLPASGSEVVVVWDAASDDKGVAGYNIYRNGQLAGITPYPVFTDTGLSTGTNYSYTVEAIDGRGQVSVASSASSPVTVDTPDSTAPPVPTAVSATATENDISLSWTQTQIDDVAGYRIYRGGIGNATTLVATITSTTYSDLNLAAATQFCYRIEAYDGAGNTSARTSETCATTGGTVTDPSSVSFSAATYQVNENTASVTITVNRAGDMSEAISVNYQTADATAVSGEDYAAASGTLNWAASDTAAKTFTVQITADSNVEGDETVSLSLTSPSATTSLGTHSTATLTIIDVNQTACNAELSDRNITVDTTLSEPCYTVPNGIWVQDPATLTIAAGVRLEFAAGQQLTVSQGGSLTAIGTAAAPITFTGGQQTPGYWDGVEYVFSNSVDNVLEHVVIEYAGTSANGNANLFMDASSSNPARISMNNVVLRHSSNYGFGFDNGTIIDQIDNVTSTANNRPGYIWANDVSQLTTNSDFTGNTEDIMYVDAGGVDTIATAQTWQNLGIPYFLESMWVGAPLTIAAGTTLIFDNQAQMYVSSDGSLKAIGTVSQPITFTGGQQTPGYWDGIEFVFSNSTENVLEHVIVEYGGTSSNGDANVHLDASTSSPARVKMSNVTLRNSNSYGFGFDRGAIVDQFDNVTSTANVRPGYLWSNDIHVLTASSDYTGNNEDIIYVDGGGTDTVSTAQTWKNLNAPYLLESQWVAAPLTIEAGTTLIFQSNTLMYVESDGSVNATGTVANPITFTGEQSTAGYWDGLEFVFSNNVANVLDHTIIEYAGGAGTPDTSANIELSCSSSSPSRLSLLNSTIKDSLGWGVIADDAGCFFTESGNTFSNNAAGNIKQ